DITKRLESFSLNTVISAFMEYNNKLVDLTGKTGVDKKTLETLTVLLAPFAPHMAEEMWELLGHDTSVFDARWPEFDEKYLVDDEIEIAVQINGKTKTTVMIAKDLDKDAAVAAGKEALGSKLTGNVVKEIYVPGRIINIVVKG
nr:class I tRNA ligase family protein [Lachnospiraceae bacterium]